MIDQTYGLIAHLPLNAILKGSQGVEFELVKVELGEGHELAADLHRLTSADLSHAFQIAPPSPSPEVEAPAGDDGSRTASPATLDEWRAAVATWDARKSEAFTAYRFEHGITKDATPDERLAAYEAFHAAYHFTEVATEPVTRPEPAERPAPSPAPSVDEGAEVDATVVQLAGKRYAALSDAVRSWVSVAAFHIRLNPDTTNGKATERRATLLGALCELAEHEMDDDDGLRAIAAHAGLGDEAWQGAPVADVVAALSVDEAHRFAAIASLVCMSLAPYEFQEGAVRCVLSSDLATAA